MNVSPKIGGESLFFGEELIEAHLLNFIARIVAMIVGGENGSVHSERGRRKRILGNVDI